MTLEIGQRFNRLVVIEESPKSTTKNRRYIFQCDCGKTKDIRKHSVTGGASTSCGCYHRERQLSLRKGNDFEIVDNVVYVKSSNTNDVFLVSLSSWPLVKEYTWSTGQTGYPITRIDKKLRKMHQLLRSDVKSPMVVDHKNRNKLDNRDENLRAATTKQNSWNMGNHRNNNSGHSGVFNKNGRWIAKIRNKQLGSFDTYEQALERRLRAEREEYGEFAPQ